MTVRLVWDGAWWVASIDQAPGCNTQGATPSEALRRLAEAYEVWSDA